MKKYTITKTSKEAFGVTIHQIKALKDFGDVKEGELGGWIESEENLSHEGNCWVYDNAKVYGEAQVYGEAHVSDNAQVSGNAQVYGDAYVYGEAYISGNAHVYGDAVLAGNASYTRGWFFGGDDTGKITNITDKTGSTYWKAQYVLGEYEITPNVEEMTVEEMTMEEICQALGKNIKIKKE